MQVRADANNIFNHPSFALPNGGLTANNGVISTGSSSINQVSVPARTMQVSARLSF
jgi:hypothetical protein